MGEFGRYQKLIYLMFSLPYVVTAMQLMGWVFIGARYDCGKAKWSIEDLLIHC